MSRRNDEHIFGGTDDAFDTGDPMDSETKVPRRVFLAGALGVASAMIAPGLAGCGHREASRQEVNPAASLDYMRYRLSGVDDINTLRKYMERGDWQVELSPLQLAVVSSSASNADMLRNHKSSVGVAEMFVDASKSSFKSGGFYQKLPPNLKTEAVAALLAGILNLDLDQDGESVLSLIQQFNAKYTSQTDMFDPNGQRELIDNMYALLGAHIANNPDEHFRYIVYENR